jgi:AraC-like DNA-binding protein/mannose-6-phosphate isomerase-like protein (cupin superfamily)
MAAPSPSLLWSRLLAGRLAWQMGGGTVRVLRVRWNQHARQADRTKAHRHPFHQVLYYSRGRGTQHLGELRRPIAPGSICFIAAGVAHSFLGTGPRPATCLALDFELEELEQRHDHHDDDAVVLRNALRAGEREVFPLSARFQRQVQTCMKRINRETEARQTGYATAVQGMLLELLALFLRATRQTPAFARSHLPPRWRNEGVVRRAVALAAESPQDEDQPQTLSRAARAVGVSPNHLNRLLRQQTGLTFRQLLIQRRIELAQAMLRTGDAMCTEIAMSCGFGDSNYFARLFKRRTGLSPTEFRRRAR